MEPCGGADARTVRQRPPDRFQTVFWHGLATALLGRATKAREDALTDHGSLVGTEHRQHLEHHGSAGRAGIEPLGVDVEVHVLGLDVAEEVDQVGQTSPDPTDGKRRDQIKVLPRDTFEQVVEGRSFVTALGSANTLIEEGGHNLPVLALGDGQQVSKLVLDGLVFVSR